MIVQEEKKVTVPSNVYRRDEYIAKLQAYAQFVHQYGSHLPMMTDSFQETLQSNIDLYSRINEHHLFSEWDYFFPALELPSNTNTSTPAETASTGIEAKGELGITENPMMAMKRKKKAIESNVIAISKPTNTFMVRISLLFVCVMLMLALCSSWEKNMASFKQKIALR